MASAIIGTTRFRLYEATLPLVHSVTTSAENGKITDSNLEIDEGGSYTVSYGCDTDHRLQSLLIDGEAVDVSQYPLSYTFTDLQEDRTIQAVFEEIRSIPSLPQLPTEPSIPHHPGKSMNLCLSLLLLMSITL